MRKTTKIVVAGLLIAAGVVLTDYLSIRTPVVRIGFAFVAMSMAGILLGPVYAGAVGAVIDILGYFLMPQGAYFPGFTVSNILHGAIYGAFLYRRRVEFWRVGAAAALSAFGVGGFLTSLWLAILGSKLTGSAYLAILTTRAVPALVMFPIQLALIFALWKALQKSHIVSAVVPS